jgi:hypothetical protein
MHAFDEMVLRSFDFVEYEQIHCLITQKFTRDDCNLLKGTLTFCNVMQQSVLIGSQYWEEDAKLREEYRNEPDKMSNHLWLTRKKILNVFFELFRKDQEESKRRLEHDTFVPVCLHEWSQLNAFTVDNLRKVPESIWIHSCRNELIAAVIAKVTEDSPFAHTFWYAIGVINEMITAYVEEHMALGDLSHEDAVEFSHQNRQHILVKAAAKHNGVLKYLHDRETGQRHTHPKTGQAHSTRTLFTSWATFRQSRPSFC